MVSLDPPNAERSSWLERTGPWLLLVFLVATKLAAVASFAAWADSDECVVGIMARHIAEHGVHPLYYYGQGYGGGGSIEAHTAAVLYGLSGMSSTSLKLAALLYTVLGFLVLYRLALRVGGANAALGTLFVYSVCPALILWGLKARGGYVGTLAIVPALLWLADRLLRHERPYGITLVVTCGLAAIGYWNMPFVLPLVLLIALFLVGQRFRRRPLVLLGGLVLFAVLGVIGGFAARGRDVANLLDRIDGIDLSGLAVRSLQRAAFLLTRTVPDVFQPYINDPVAETSWPQPVLLALSLAAFAYVVWTLVAHRGEGTPRPTVFFLLAYVPFHLICCVLAAPSLREVSPRYLFPVVPAVALIGGLVLARVSRWVRWGVVAVLLMAFGFYNADLYRCPRVQEHGVFYDPSAIPSLIAALDREGVRHVHTTYVLQWRILFESRERIVAVDLHGRHRYRPYIETCKEAATRDGFRLAYVFRKDGRWSRLFLDIDPEDFEAELLRRKAVDYRRIEAGPYVLFVTSRPVVDWETGMPGRQSAASTNRKTAISSHSS